MEVTASHHAYLEVAGEHARLVAAVDSYDGTRHVTTVASLEEEQVKAEEGGRGREKTEAGKRDESYSRRKTERQERSLLSGTED
jgi:hypothetical protein